MPLAAGICESARDSGFPHASFADRERELRFCDWPFHCLKLHGSCAFRSGDLKAERLFIEDMLPKPQQIFGANDWRARVFSCEDVRFWEAALNKLQCFRIFACPFLTTTAAASTNYDTVQNYFCDLGTYVLLQYAR